jgi:hypothetical protein
LNAIPHEKEERARIGTEVIGELCDEFSTEQQTDIYTR